MSFFTIIRNIQYIDFEINSNCQFNISLSHINYFKSNPNLTVNYWNFDNRLNDNEINDSTFAFLNNKTYLQVKQLKETFIKYNEIKQMNI